MAILIIILVQCAMNALVPKRPGNKLIALSAHYSHIEV